MNEGHRERAITAERTRISAREDRYPRESMPGGLLPARIAVSKDRWRDNSRCGKCRCARRHRACARPRTLSHLEACGKNRRSMCCHALCGYAYDTWMLQDAFILRQKSLLREKCRIKPRRQETENVSNRNKVRVFIQCISLTSCLYYCCVFNLVVNYPMNIITPRNWVLQKWAIFE